MNFLKSILVVFLALAAVDKASGQAVLSVSSQTPDAFVVVDTSVVGTVSDSPFELVPGEHVIRLLPADVRAWEQQGPEIHATLTECDTVSVTLDFDYRIRLESVPFGAQVELAGLVRPPAETPVSIFLAPGDSIEVRLTRDGFRPARSWLYAEEPMQRETIYLQPDAVLDEDGHAVAWEPPRRRNQWIDYGAAGLALAAGVTAVHFKFKADSLFDEYERTGDPGFRPQIRRYDIYSGVALGAMQVGVGVLAVRILLR